MEKREQGHIDTKKNQYVRICAQKQLCLNLMFCKTTGFRNGPL